MAQHLADLKARGALSEVALCTILTKHLHDQWLLYKFLNTFNLLFIFLWREEKRSLERGPSGPPCAGPFLCPSDANGQ